MTAALERAKALLTEGGYTVVLCRGEVTYTDTRRGVAPLLRLLDAATDVRGFVAADKVVGKAAAFLYLRLGVAAVHAGVISAPARDLLIAQRCADIMAASRLFKDGYSFQTGAGAIPVACTNFLADYTENAEIKASFALGGMTGAIVEMHKRGLLRSMLCSQSFDVVAARAIADNPTILEIDNSMYANMFNKSCALDKLNFGVLGALEVDTDFNINILTGSSGEMMGGLGGGPDVADGADISIVTLPIIRGRIPSVVDKVFTCCTPGSSVAVVVTEAGIALNPKHKNYEMLKEDLEKAGVKTVSIQYLRDMAYSLTGFPKPVETTDKVTCIVEYRDGTVIDVIYQRKGEV